MPHGGSAPSITIDFTQYKNMKFTYFGKLFHDPTAMILAVNCCVTAFGTFL